MRVRVLGPVAVDTDTTTVEVDVPKHRALLTALALRDGAVASVGELVDAVWGDDPPASAAKTLQGYVSALRKQFGEDIIATDAGGYSLGPAVDEVDAIALRDAVTDGRQHLELEHPAAARRAFASALALWRSRPLGDLAPGRVRDGQAARLDELHLLAIEGEMEAELAVGHHRETVPDLERLVAEHPYREVLWRLLMLALYRSGRPADALGAHRRLRTVLVEELGIEPSAATRDLEMRILDQDPALDPPGTTPPTNLVAPLDSFVDRQAECGAIVDVLARHRLVTVLGIGGVGKSRLAIEVGRRRVGATPGGVWWIDLAAVPSSRPVLVHAATALDLPAAPGDSLEAVLLGRLRVAPALLVLDNCEHLREQVAAFVEWVTAHDPLVRVLATSRLPLGVPGEYHVHLEPLATVRRERQDLADASRLFLDRASTHADLGRGDLADVETLTGLVGGLPLGIELAAAQCSLRAPSELARMLHDRGAILGLSGDEHVPARHASLAVVLDATFDTLDPVLARTAPRLAVFPGDFDLTAATAVLGTTRADAERDLARLLDASLVTPTPSEAPRRRFRVLWPVREHLIDRLDDAARLDAEERHARHFRALARRFVGDVNTPGEVASLEHSLFDEHNLRIALAWFETHDPGAALVFAPGLGWAWQEHGDLCEGRDTLRRVLAGAPDAPSELVAWTEEALAWLELLSGEPEAAFAHSNDAVARFEAADDARGLSRALGGHAHALHLGGFDTAVTTPLYERSIDVARAGGLEFAVARLEVWFAHSLTAAEELDRVDVDAMLSHAESVLRRHGDHTELAHAALGRAFIAFGRSDTAATHAAGEEILRQGRLARSKLWEQVAHLVLGLTGRLTGAEDESRAEFRAAVHIAHETANRAQLGIALHALAAVSAERTPESAALLWGAAGAMTPIWPLHARRYGDWLESARAELGERFDELVAQGAALSVDDAVAIADSIL